MKGLLGRKVGMTSVFTDHGKNIPVSVIEVLPNTVTAVLSQEKDGYVATQLAAFDRRDKTSTKPELGHFKKAKTTAKYFVKEIRNMEGHELGATLDVSLFNTGELVDITGTSKGKGFQGNIKRHNQHIGPKSHGGGGGSKPTRQTGSLGDVSSNRVFKGQTMPGQMGNTRVTVQNLEIVSIDKSNNIILIKGSIPGPNKGYVIVEEAVKGLPNKEAVKLVDVKEAEVKNTLLKEAKSAGADVNTDMSVEEMKAAIAAAKEAKEAEKAAKEAEEKAAEESKKAEAVEKAAEKAAEEVKKAEASGDVEAAKEAEEKAEALAKQAEAEKAKAEEAKAEAKEAEAEKAAKEAEAAKHQVETEDEEEEAPKKEAKEEAKGDA